jgi:hypothetical protein
MFTYSDALSNLPSQCSTSVPVVASDKSIVIGSSCYWINAGAFKNWYNGFTTCTATSGAQFAIFHSNDVYQVLKDSNIAVRLFNFVFIYYTRLQTGYLLWIAMATKPLIAMNGLTVGTMSLRKV